MFYIDSLGCHFQLTLDVPASESLFYVNLLRLFVRRSRLTRLCLVSLSVVLECCVCRPASLGRLHSCIPFHLSSLLDRVSAASSFSRAGPGAMPRGQQLMGLRKALYRALRSAFRASRRATCHMLKAYPSPEDERLPHNDLFLGGY